MAEINAIYNSDVFQIPTFHWTSSPVVDQTCHHYFVCFEILPLPVVQFMSSFWTIWLPPFKNENNVVYLAWRLYYWWNCFQRQNFVWPNTRLSNLASKGNKRFNIPLYRRQFSTIWLTSTKNCSLDWYFLFLRFWNIK